MSRRRGLGKGLAGLIPASGPLGAGMEVSEIAIELIDSNPFQPRRDFGKEELAELAASIRAQGLLQPITVRPAQEGRFQLVAGERRLRAVIDLGHSAIRAIVREVDDRQLQELTLVENLIRADLNDIEVAEGLSRLQNRYTYSTSELAEVTGKSRPAVSNTLRLLELPEPVRELIRGGKLSAGHGRAVLSFPAEQREAVAAECVGKGWSVRELENRASQASKRPPIKRPRKKTGAMSPRTATLPATPPASIPPELKRAKQQLIEHLGTKVKITEAGGSGAITISYHGAEDLARILDLLLRGADPL
ncbi:ParB/RepB/Spo0J family partition protein [bacterium]|nr:ParB/RepB/Spo0J family partition protein [bacterium]